MLLAYGQLFDGSLWLLELEKRTMIIFDLDGTLANCEHRRHLVDFDKAYATDQYFADGYEEDCPIYLRHKITKEKWKPDWNAFYEACERDEPIEATLTLLEHLYNCRKVEIGIWSGRSASVLKKTELWLYDNCFPFLQSACEQLQQYKIELKMRPIGNTEPDEVLKGRWLDEAIAEGKIIDYVFDDRPKMVRFWRSRGIFCFDVNQTGADF